jgi:hypothetical protein
MTKDIKELPEVMGIAAGLIGKPGQLGDLGIPIVDDLVDFGRSVGGAMADGAHALVSYVAGAPPAVAKAAQDAYSMVHEAYDWVVERKDWIETIWEYAGPALFVIGFGLCAAGPGCIAGIVLMEAGKTVTATYVAYEAAKETIYDPIKEGYEEVKDLVDGDDSSGGGSGGNASLPATPVPSVPPESEQPPPVPIRPGYVDAGGRRGGQGLIPGQPSPPVSRPAGMSTKTKVAFAVGASALAFSVALLLWPQRA